MPASIPEDDARRLAVLRAHGILDTPPDRVFDDLTSLAAELCDTPMAAVSLVDEHRQWFKSRIGFDLQQTGRGESFCGHVVAQRELMVVENAAVDARFADNPLVRGNPNIRFYAGAPLMSHEGEALGTLCVFDRRPRHFTQAMRRKLTVLSRQVSRELELHRLLKQAERVAMEDALTGLPNRRGLLHTLSAALEDWRQGRAGRVVLVYIDLDRFKPINDSYGHEAGDAVLRATGGRLLDAARAIQGVVPVRESCVARLGGDEFVVMLAGDYEEDWAKRKLARRLFDAVAQPVSWQDKELAVVCSCGVALADEADITAEHLLRDADIAMYDAKRARGRAFSTFTPTMRSELMDQVELESDLRRAIDHDQLDAAFQPIVSLHDNGVVGVEALARWRHPQRGPVSPLRFIDCAERTGLIDRLFDRVVERAVEGFMRLGGLPQAPAWMSLNLSRLQLLSDGLCDRLVRTLEKSGVDRSRVHLEITESLVGNDESVIRQLHRLREAGFVLMLDDFGVGASALSCLHSFPIDWIKIDHQFMHNAFERRDLAAVLHAIAQLAVSLDLAIVAEGIEHADHVPMLQAMDIGYGQGYYLSPPLSAEAFHEWCARYNPRSSHKAA